MENAAYILIIHRDSCEGGVPANVFLRNTLLVSENI